MRLREIAHARTGDKGRLLTISLIAYRAHDFPLLEHCVTAGLLSQIFAPILAAPVARYSIPSLHALNFVLQRAAEKSVTRSLSLDAHGKCLGDVLLDFELSLPEAR
jgi:hypothetical protein